jgi:O-antigen ligase
LALFYGMIQSRPFSDTGQQLSLLALVILLGGGLFSRFLLSAGSGLLVIAACWPRRSGSSWARTDQWYAVLLATLFLWPLISGIWSSDTTEWWKRVQVKLPFLLFPLAFWRMGDLPPVFKKYAEYCFIAAVLVGTGWSCSQYLGNFAAINDSYHYAGVLPTPLDDDHVRFSWAVLIAILLLARRLLHAPPALQPEKWILGVILVWCIAYLHLLAAKTGLIGLYLAAIVVLMQQLRRGNRKIGLLAVFLLLLLPVLAYWGLPSFHHRIHYIVYDFNQYSRGVFPGGRPDGARVLSWMGGWQLFTTSPWTGIGYGDTWNAIQQWYSNHFPHTPPHDRLFPSNQYLLYACGTGILGGLTSVVTALYPMLSRMRSRPMVLAFHTGAAFFFFFEMHLEGQYGVFLYCFFALWLSKSVS